MKHVIFDVSTGEQTEIDFTAAEIADRNRESEIEAWKILRNERNKLLQESDVLVVLDRFESYTAEQKEEISLYRKALRNLPQDTSNPFAPVWPSKPVLT